MSELYFGVKPRDIQLDDDQKGHLLFEIVPPVDDYLSIMVFNPSAAHCVSIDEEDNFIPVCRDVMHKGKVCLNFESCENHGDVVIVLEARLVNSGISSQGVEVIVHQHQEK